jgi:hypothetical protein
MHSASKPHEIARPRLIGYWASTQDNTWPDVEGFVDATWDAAKRARVVGYLRRGRRWRGYRGFSRCRLCGEPNGSSELTDGSWVWPEGLAHYVEDHYVRLPEAFVRSVSAEVRLQLRAVAPECEPDRDWWLGQRPSRHPT